MDDKTIHRLRFVVNACYFTVIALLVYLGWRYVIGWTLPFLLAFVMVSIVHPLIQKLREKLHIRRAVVAFVIVLLIYVVIFAALAGLVLLLVMGAQRVFEQLPQYYEDTLSPALADINQRLNGFIGDLPQEWTDQLAVFQSDVVQTLQTLLLNASQRGIRAVSGFTGKIPAFAVGLVFTILLSFFISIQYQQVLAFLKGVTPRELHAVGEDLRKVMLQTVGQYLRAVVTMMMITAVELCVGLFLIGQEHFLIIAVGIAVFDALPFVGTGAIMIPWAVLALIRGDIRLGLCIGFLYAFVALVRSFIEPKIVSDKLGLNPIVSLCAIYLGFRVFGVLGMIFMPIVAQIGAALYQHGSLPFLEGIFGPPEGEA